MGEISSCIISDASFKVSLFIFFDDKNSQVFFRFNGIGATPPAEILISLIKSFSTSIKIDEFTLAMSRYFLFDTFSKLKKGGWGWGGGGARGEEAGSGGGQG